MNETAVSIKDLQFSYGGQSGSVFSKLNIDIKAGDRFGLFGPNGAGKTTLMNCMTGLLQFQQGSISLLGTQIIPHKKISTNFLDWFRRIFLFTRN